MKNRHILILSLLATAPFSQAALIGYWNFDDDSLIETSGFKAAGTHDGIAEGAIAYTTGPANFGRALDLTGGDVAVKVKNSNLQNLGSGGTGGGTNPTYENTFDSAINTSNMTIAAWVQGLPNDQWEPFVANKGESHGYQLRRHSSSNGTTLTLRGTAGADDPAGSISIADGAWHHVTGVWDRDNGNRLLYVDGVLDTAGSIQDGTDTGDVAAATWEYLVFGARDYQGGLQAFSQVKLDEIRIYNEPLDQTQVQALLVPEPSSTWLGVLGALALIRRRR